MGLVKTLLLLFCVYCVSEALSDVEYFQLRELPGLDFLGYGYDARYDNYVEALRLPVLGWSYSEKKNYIYPLFNETYRVPNELYAITIASTDVQGKVFETWEELRDNFTIGVGIPLSPDLSSSATTVCQVTPGEGSNQTCQVTEITRNRTASAGIFAQYVSRVLETQENWVTDTVETSKMFRMFLNPDFDFVRQELKQAGQELSNVDIQSDPQKYFSFLERYGTHYVTSVTMGGKIQLITLISKNHSDAVSYINATVSANFTTEENATRPPVQHVSQQEALTSSRGHFVSALQAGVDFGYEQVRSVVEYSSTYYWKLYGGDTTALNLVDANSSSRSVQEWKQTVPSNPIPVQYKLEEISNLFGDDPFLSRQMGLAVELFLSQETKDIVSIDYPPDWLE